MDYQTGLWEKYLVTGDWSQSNELYPQLVFKLISNVPSFGTEATRGIREKTLTAVNSWWHWLIFLSIGFYRTALQYWTWVHLCLDRQSWANRIDPDQMPHCGIWFVSTLFASYPPIIGGKIKTFFFKFQNKYGKELSCQNNYDYMVHLYYICFQRFEGNSNTYLAELRQVEPPIIGKRLRFIPYCRHPRTVCMRVEIYGCPWEGKRIEVSHAKRHLNM